jgi:ubiquitin C-terminal hydrolase
MNLYSCLNTLIKPEILAGYKCDKCGDKSESRKILLPINFANNIVFVIKQYQNSHRRIPLETMESIDLGTFIFDTNNKRPKIEKKYQLVSAIIHYGSLNGGHYRAVSKRNDEWFLLDDENIYKLDNIRDVDRSYMLFYEAI